MTSGMGSKNSRQVVPFLEHSHESWVTIYVLRSARRCLPTTPSIHPVQILSLPCGMQAIIVLSADAMPYFSEIITQHPAGLDFFFISYDGFFFIAFFKPRLGRGMWNQELGGG